MKKSFNISEIAQLLNVSSPTLRYWEEMNLFKVKKKRNSYREFFIEDLSFITDTVFYRNIGVPVKEIKKFFENDIEYQHNVLKSIKVDNENKIADLISLQNSIEKYVQIFDEVSKFDAKEFFCEEIPFDRIVMFEYTDKEKVKRYIKDTSLYVRLIELGDEKSETRGIISDSLSENAIWARNKDNKYITFLIKEVVNMDYKSNLEEKLEKLRGKYSIKNVLLRYLLTANDNGQQTDYLKAYAEINEVL